MLVVGCDLAASFFFHEAVAAPKVLSAAWLKRQFSDRIATAATVPVTRVHLALTGLVGAGATTRLFRSLFLVAIAALEALIAAWFKR